MGGHGEWTKRLSDATTKTRHQCERKGTEVKGKEGLQHCSSMATCSNLLFCVWNSLGPSPTVYEWDTDKILRGWRGFKSHYWGYSEKDANQILRIALCQLLIFSSDSTVVDPS